MRKREPCPGLSIIDFFCSPLNSCLSPDPERDDVTDAQIAAGACARERSRTATALHVRGGPPRGRRQPPPGPGCRANQWWEGHVGRGPEASHRIPGAREIVGPRARTCPAPVALPLLGRDSFQRLCCLAVASGPVACGSEALCHCVVHRPPSLPACRATRR